MRISATPNSRENGFTLIELMVVIAILGLMSAAVIFNIPDSRGSLVDEAERFAARVVALRDEAVITSRETRVRITPTGYNFERRRRGEWAAIEEKPLRPANWDEGTKASVGEIVFDTTGLANEAQRILISRDDARVAVDFGVDGSIRVAG
jgi:general secretion pathway protein H